MITFMGEEVTPTRFPDGTTQVWKLPKSITPGPDGRMLLDWRFEREDELFIIAQLADLYPDKLSLHVPYLPFARQDKQIAMDASFALWSFSAMLNHLGLKKVTAVDVHNPSMTSGLISHFTNISPEPIHKDLIADLKPDMIVFPDEGAVKRYPWLAAGRHVVFGKERDQATGWIKSYFLITATGDWKELRPGMKLLVIDDLCDGGMTFQLLAKKLNESFKPAKLDLFVTHGLFSKGRKPLEDAGYTLHTTNSLPRNPDGISV